MTHVAVVQLDAADLATTTAQAVRAVERAADDGAALVVLPEYASGWAATVTPALAEPTSGPFVTALRDVARRGAVTVIVGTMTPGEDRCANLALAIAPDGSLAGTYTKVHLFDAFGYRESEALAPGPADAPPLVVPVGDLRFGVEVCYDIRFPESARRLVDAGADVLVVIAAWAAGPGKAEQLQVLARARAIENTAYLVLACQDGSGRAGSSAVVDPLGRVLVEAAADASATRPAGAATILHAELDPAAVAAARRRVPVLANRRYDVVPRP